MKNSIRRNFRFGLILMIFASPAAAQEQSSAQPDTLAWLQISSETTGLDVYVNDIWMGITPVDLLSVPAGELTVRVTHAQSSSWFVSDWQQSVTSEVGDTLNLVPTFRQAYHLQSRPHGAEVWHGEVRLGRTPFVLELNEQETAQIRLHKDGYSDRTIVCSPEQSHYMVTNLVPIDDYWQEQEVLNKRLLGKRKRYRRTAIYSAVASAVTGVAAVLLKREADRNFEQYERALTPERQNALFQKTKDFDRYSGIAFGAFQLSFGLSIYYFIRSNQNPGE